MLVEQVVNFRTPRIFGALGKTECGSDPSSIMIHLTVVSKFGVALLFLELQPVRDQKSVYIVVHHSWFSKQHCIVQDGSCSSYF